MRSWEAKGESRVAAWKQLRPRLLLGIAVAMASLAAVVGSGCGDSDSPDLESLLKWEPADYRTLPPEMCQQFAQDAGSLIPSQKGSSGASRGHQADCHWSTTGGKRFRAMSFKITLAQPSPVEHLPALAVASRDFRYSVGLTRKGLPLEKVEEVRALPGLGDEATVVYGISQDDVAVVQIDMRKHNVQFDIIVQASDTKYVTASDGSGVYPVTTPLSKSVVEDVAVQAGRHMLSILPPQSG